MTTAFANLAGDCVGVLASSKFASARTAEFREEGDFLTRL